jgi:glycosyltransferase involved in cell wall biosynthesis
VNGAREVVVMVTTSYPRFAGDTVGTFMEPIAQGLAARGHEVHLVLPWHPRLRRAEHEGRIHFHPFKYAPADRLNVFGYAGALKADVALRPSAVAVAPIALAAGWRMATRIARMHEATVVHGHWVIPGGAIAAAAAGPRPLVISLHGSDVYVAERHAIAGRVARWAFGRAHRVTACSDDLRERAIALGANRDRAETLPYGVDAARFAPDARVRAVRRRALGLNPNDTLLFTAGRFVRKKGFEYLVDALPSIAAAYPRTTLAIAGGGDLDAELRQRARDRGVADRIRFLGVLSQSDVADFLIAADLIIVPSVRDDRGNVDGLPNFVLEGLASGTAVVTTAAGGIGAVVRDGVTAAIIGERDAEGLRAAVHALLADPARRAAIGEAARQEALALRGWDRYAEHLERVYAAARAEIALPSK